MQTRTGFAEQQLWSAVVERRNEARVGLERRPVLARHAQVADLDLALVIVQDVGRLQVPVQHPVVVQVLDAVEQLIH